MNNNSFLTIMGAIAAGAIAGLLLSPKTGRENRDWVNRSARDATDWLDKKSREAVNTSGETMNRYTEKMRQSMPDLYEVTKKITFQK